MTLIQYSSRWQAGLNQTQTRYWRFMRLLQLFDVNLASETPLLLLAINLTSVILAIYCIKKQKIKLLSLLRVYLKTYMSHLVIQQLVHY